MLSQRAVCSAVPVIHSVRESPREALVALRKLCPYELDCQSSHEVTTTESLIDSIHRRPCWGILPECEKHFTEPSH